MKLPALLLAAIPYLYAGELSIQHQTNEQSEIHVDSAKKFILLPIQDKADEVDMQLLLGDKTVSEAPIRIRLAREQVDYYIPVEIEADKDFKLQINGLPQNALCWDKLELSDEFKPVLDEPFRPIYHHTPQYGWMNDPNGMFYKDGVYHLYFQFNPWGARWANLSWGHSTTTDFYHWDFHGAVLVPDELGRIFSGSSIVDSQNSAGFGKDAVLAFYTSAGHLGQVQSMAYSTDNGKSFTKYDNNPILADRGGDFRDPKVFYHEPTDKYIMVVTIGNGNAIYSSQNLIDWTRESEFGEGQGCHDGIWECPDLFPLSSPNGDTKWVMLSNISNGSPMGGSGTQYFIGDFDGKTFTNDSEPKMVKWQNYGRDHYASVTWANAPKGRAISTAWMTNSHYTDDIPTKHFRGANTIPRELFIFEEKGELYLGSLPTPEIEQHRVEAKALSAASEINFTLEPKAGATTGQFALANDKGEQVKFTVDFTTHQLTIDRSQSGSVNFYGGFSSPISGHIFGEGYHFRIFLDKNSVECFVNGGRSVFSNLTFPSTPYTQLNIEPKGFILKEQRIYNYK